MQNTTANRFEYPMIPHGGPSVKGYETALALKLKLNKYRSTSTDSPSRGTSWRFFQLGYWLPASCRDAFSSLMCNDCQLLIPPVVMMLQSLDNESVKTRCGTSWPVGVAASWLRINGQRAKWATDALACQLVQLKSDSVETSATRHASTCSSWMKCVKRPHLRLKSS